MTDERRGSSWVESQELLEFLGRVTPVFEVSEKAFNHLRIFVPLLGQPLMPLVQRMISTGVLVRPGPHRVLDTLTLLELKKLAKQLELSSRGDWAEVAQRLRTEASFVLESAAQEATWWVAADPVQERIDLYRQKFEQDFVAAQRRSLRALLAGDADELVAAVLDFEAQQVVPRDLETYRSKEDFIAQARVCLGLIEDRLLAPDLAPDHPDYSLFVSVCMDLLWQFSREESHRWVETWAELKGRLPRL